MQNKKVEERELSVCKYCRKKFNSWDFEVIDEFRRVFCSEVCCDKKNEIKLYTQSEVDEIKKEAEKVGYIKGRKLELAVLDNYFSTYPDAVIDAELVYKKLQEELKLILD